MLFGRSRLLAATVLCITTATLAQTPATAPAAKPVAPTANTAKAGNSSSHAGKVWGNPDSKIYHCEGDRYWGTTKNGDYMTLAEAKAKGMTAAKNSKNCKE